MGLCSVDVTGGNVALGGSYFHVSCDAVSRKVNRFLVLAKSPRSMDETNC